MNEPDNNSNFLCEICANELLISYMFLLKLRSSENRVHKTDEPPRLVKNVEIIEIDYIEDPKEILFTKGKGALPIKKQKVGWNVSLPLNTLQLSLPAFIVTPYYYFTTFEDSKRGIIKILNVAPKRKYLI